MLLFFQASAFPCLAIAIRYGSFGSPVPPLYLASEGTANEKNKIITKQNFAVLPYT
jgi:hypothetical protein